MLTWAWQDHLLCEFQQTTSCWLQIDIRLLKANTTTAISQNLVTTLTIELEGTFTSGNQPT